MRNPVIDRKLQHLGVNHDEAAFIGAETIQQAQDHGIDPDGFARTRGAGNQQMRHARKVRDHRRAADILAECQGQLARVAMPAFITEHFGKEHGFALGIGHFNADHIAPRHGCDAHRNQAHGPRDIVSQANHARGFGAGRGFQFIQSHHRAGADFHNAPAHTVIFQHAFQKTRIGLQRFLGRPAHTLRGGGGQQIKRRQRPGAITKIKCRLLRRAARGFGWFARAHWWGFAPCIGRLRADRHGLGRRIGGAQHGAQGDFGFLAAEQAASAGFEARTKPGEKAGLLRFRFLSRAQLFCPRPRRIQGGLAGAKRRAASAAPFAEGQAAADKAGAHGTEDQPGLGQQGAIGAKAAGKPGNHAIGQKRPNCAAGAGQARCLRRQGR